MSRVGSLGARLYRGEVSYDFIGHRKLWYTVSLVLIAVSVVSLLVRGLTLGIEFRGGAEFRVAAPSASEESVRDTVGDVVERRDRRADASATTRSGLRPRRSPARSSRRCRPRLAERFDVARDDVSTQFIGPSWGRDISTKALRALVFFLIGIVIFLSLYFEWKMALAAMIALLHDLLITAGLYSLVGFEVTPATVIGFLTILGYSLYDTVVVFDKVRENTARPGRRQPDDLQRRGQPGRQPDPGAVHQHLDHRAAPDRGDPVRRRRAARRRPAQGPVAGAVHRCRRRCLLVDVHRTRPARGVQGARAGDAGARQAGRRPPGQGRDDRRLAQRVAHGGRRVRPTRTSTTR